MQTLWRVSGRLVTAAASFPKCGLVFPDVGDRSGILQCGALGPADGLVSSAAECDLENRDQRVGAGIHLVDVSFIRRRDRYHQGGGEDDAVDVRRQLTMKSDSLVGLTG